MGEKIISELEKYWVSGDYELSGNIKLLKKDYYTNTPEEAVKEAEEDGLVRLISVELTGED